MIRSAALIFALTAIPATAGCELPEQQQKQERPADAFELESVKWQKRVVLLFAAGPADPAYKRQQELLAQVRDDMEERHLVVIAAFADGSGMLDGRPIDQKSVRTLRRDFQPRPNAFTFVLVGKDGTEKMRETGRPAKPENVFETIDAMPMRQQEMERQSEATGK